MFLAFVYLRKHTKVCYIRATERNILLITNDKEKQRLLLLSLMKFSLIIFIKAQDVVVLMES